MNTDLFIESLFSSLISGDRNAARRMVDAATEHEITAATWPPGASQSAHIEIVVYMISYENGPNYI